MILLTSCSGGDNGDILKFTTDKTLAISKVNLEQFNDKLPKDEIAKDTSNHFSKSEKEKFKLFMNAEDNGIDIEQPLYIIVDESKGKYVFSFLLWLDDTKKFQDNFSKITDTKVTIDKTNNMVYSDGNLIGSVYGEDRIVLSKVSNYGDYSYSDSGDSNADITFYKDFWARKSNVDSNVKDQINAALDDKVDMSAWINFHGIVSAASKGYIETLAVNKLLVNAGISFNVNFEVGKVVMNSKTFFNDDLKKLIEKHYEGKEINYNILNGIDIDQAKSYGVGYISFDFIKYFVKEAGFESSINHYLEYKDLTFDEITNALNGDYAFVSYKDNLVVENEMYGPYDKPNSILAIGINGAKAKKIVDMLHSDGMFSSFGSIFNNNNILAFATDEKKLELLKNNKKAINKLLSKKSDINAYSWTSGEDFNKSYTNIKEAKFKFENMISSSKVSDGNFTTELSLSIDKKKKNVIHYLMGYE